MGIVYVQDRVVSTRDSGELPQVWRVPGHAVDSVHADQAGRRPISAEHLLEIVWILEPETLDGRPAGGRELAAVVDRLVRSVVHEDRAIPGENRNDGKVDQGDRRENQRVFTAEQRDESFFDLLVEDGASEHPRPAGMRAPLLEIRGNGIDDLALEIEPEIVAGSEVGEPLVADSDHAPVDFVDDRVGHRIGAFELGELATCRQPPVDPTVGSMRGPRSDRTKHTHAHKIGLLNRKL